MAAERLRLPPYRTISRAINEIQRLAELPSVLAPIRYQEVGARVYDRDAMAPGVTLLTSCWRDFDWMPGIRLIDAEGKVLHRWRFDASKIWPTPPHKDRWSGLFNGTDTYLHGTYLFENGDVVFNVERMGLVRMNAAGEVLWRVPYRTHHAVFRDEDGNFWVCGIKWMENNEQGRKRAADYPGLKLPCAEDHVVKVSPDGEVLKDISVLKVLYESGNQHLLWKIAKRQSLDLTHMNDVEVLGTELADQYPLFDAGDILFSLRRTHTVCVIDPDTETVKWLSTGPFMEQHDPDFLGNGWIGILDNNSDGTDATGHLGGSRIVAVKPGSGETRVLYPRSGSQHFFTEVAGKFQHFNNGNLLITEATAGRALEVDSEGRLLWEWINEPYNDKYVAEVMEATRYNLTAEQVSTWAKAPSQ
ncbi:arylsulfotransferase family protein [Planctomycetota bacterium]